MRKSRKSTMLSTEDSRSKWYTEHEFCIKIVHHPPPLNANSPPPHTHSHTNRQKVLSTEDSYGYSLIETLYRSLGESTMNVTIMTNEHKDFVLGLR